MLAANAIDIGNIVRRRRAAAGLSQAQLADATGVSRKWIADLEKGHPRAQLQLVLDVLNALDALVEVVDAPRDEPAVSVPKPAGIAEMAVATERLPRVEMSSELRRAITRAGEGMQLSADARRIIAQASQFATVNSEQMARIRNALAHAHLDDDTLRVIRSASKELTRAEAERAGVPDLRGSGDDDRGA